MILRSFSNHLKNNNWFAVLVELLVVVVGVYGAFQLESWGEGLRENQRESLLLEQLHSEIEYALPKLENQLQSAKDHVSGAQQVASELMKPVGSGELNEDRCENLFEISILKWQPLSLTTLDEMVSSGIHSQLDDRGLSTLLLSLNAEIRSLDSYMQLARSQQNVLMDQYPNLIPRGVDANGEGFLLCDVDAMRVNQSFINHLMSNIGRYGGMVRFFEGQLASLQSVHNNLDKVLQKSRTKNYELHKNKADL